MWVIIYNYYVMKHWTWNVSIKQSQVHNCDGSVNDSDDEHNNSLGQCSKQIFFGKSVIGYVSFCMT